MASGVRTSPQPAALALGLTLLLAACASFNPPPSVEEISAGLVIHQTADSPVVKLCGPRVLNRAPSDQWGDIVHLRLLSRLDRQTGTTRHRLLALLIQGDSGFRTYLDAYLGELDRLLGMGTATGESAGRRVPGRRMCARRRDALRCPALPG